MGQGGSKCSAQDQLFLVQRQTAPVRESAPVPCNKELLSEDLSPPHAHGRPPGSQSQATLPRMEKAVLTTLLMFVLGANPRACAGKEVNAAASAPTPHPRLHVSLDRPARAPGVTVSPCARVCRFPGVRLRPGLPAGSPRSLGGPSERAGPEPLPAPGVPERRQEGEYRPARLRPHRRCHSGACCSAFQGETVVACRLLGAAFRTEEGFNYNSRHEASERLWGPVLRRIPPSGPTSSVQMLRCLHPAFGAAAPGVPPEALCEEPLGTRREAFSSPAVLLLMFLGNKSRLLS